MSGCCAEPIQTADATPADATSKEGRLTCPVCELRGKAVDTQTIKAMLAVSLQAVRATGYRFCSTPDCPVVYFATDGSQTFGETELRAKVHQKHPDEDDVWICYCFRQSAGMIRKELNQTGISTAVDAIQAGIRAGQCACDIRNPQGNCCLGNVRATVKRLILSANPSV